jgi:arginase family enzyme
MRDVRRLGVEAGVRDALERAGDGTSAIAFDVDLDVLDCSHAPGVCSPEPGGTSLQLLDAIDMLGESRRISLVEVVELIPIFDPSGLRARIACYVLVNLLGAYATAPVGSSAGATGG